MSEQPFKPKAIVDWRVGEVFIHNEKYAFRIYLTFDDNEKRIQEKGGFVKKSDAKSSRDYTVGCLHNKTFVAESPVTVEEFLEWWIEYFKEKRKPTYSTYSTYRYNLKNHIVPAIGHLKLARLSRGILLQTLTRIAAKSKSSAQMSLVVLRTALPLAVEYKLLSADVISKLALPKEAKQQSEPYHTRVIDSKSTLTLDQCIELLIAARETKIFLHILFALTLGLRKSEILGLRYNDIDPQTHILHVSRQLGVDIETYDKAAKKGNKTKQPVKLKTNSSDRYLYVPDFVYDIICDQRKIYEANRARRPSVFRDEDYICCSTSGNPRSKEFHYKTFKELLQKLELPNIRWHDLRNTYATLLCSNNISLKAISVALGHATEIVTDEHYINKNLLRVIIPTKIEGIMAELLEDTKTDSAAEVSCAESTQNDKSDNPHITLLETQMLDLVGSR